MDDVHNEVHNLLGLAAAIAAFAMLVAALVDAWRAGADLASVLVVAVLAVLAVKLRAQRVARPGLAALQVRLGPARRSGAAAVAGCSAGAPASRCSEPSARGS